MNFTRHSPHAIAGKHALLSPSNPAWLNYEEDKMARVFFAQEAARKGAALHALAHDLIEHRVRLPDEPLTLNMYVNDAIGFRLTPEQILFYSENCFGTADAIGFRNNFLRVADLKNGINEASFKQLLIYAALFCLEYKFKPNEIQVELRIYQNNAVKIEHPGFDDLTHTIDRIVTLDKQIRFLREEVTP